MKIELTSESELSRIVQMERNHENADFITPYNLERHKKVIQEKDEEHLSIFDSSCRLVGFVILAGLTNINKSIEFKRIVISKKGEGHGSKAIELIKKKCFLDYNCNKLWLDVFDFNQRAIYIYEKLGFKKDGVIRESIKTSQGLKNLVNMSILKSEFNKMKLN